jgi:hypothetical protein
MTTTTITSSIPTGGIELHHTHDTAETHFVRTGAITAVTAAVAATATGAVAHAAGVPLSMGGQSVPLYAFAQLTIFAVVIGTGIAAVFHRRASRPRHTFVVTTLVLTALSFIPDVLVNAHTTTKLALVLAHVAAAAVAIPALASRLAD